MALPSTYLAEEALSLPPEQRQQLAKLLLDSLRPDGRTDNEWREELRARLDDLRSGKDTGRSFEQVFGEPAWKFCSALSSNATSLRHMLVIWIFRRNSAPISANT